MVLFVTGNWDVGGFRCQLGLLPAILAELEALKEELRFLCQRNIHNVEIEVHSSLIIQLIQHDTNDKAL